MRIRNLFLIVFAALLSVTTAFNQLFAHDPVKIQTDSTRWIVELPVWVPGFRGAISWGDVNITGGGGGFLDKIFNSTMKLDYYYVGKVRYSYQKWRLQWDIYGGQIDNSVKFVFQDGSLIDTKIDAIIPRLFVGYRIFDKDFDNEKAGRINSYLYSGARFFNIGILANLPEPFKPLELKTSWVNPIVGISFSYYQGKFTFTSQADIGLIEAFSNPTWWFQLHSRYRLRHRVSLSLGWVMQDIRRGTELLSQDFRYKARLTGPMAGFAIHF
ncbi:MAG: hypothetical protein KAR19_19295 [Bacteroidales bacterium]|nr:hypothetical protein [Bacteroidales bacterium]